MDVDAPLPVKGHHVHQRHFDRLVMLSDGVFAIAMTLSAVELKPVAQPGESLAQVWGLSLLTYFVSFFIIGGVWIRHRRALAHLRYVDMPLTLINLLLLSLVALMPVVIRVLLGGEGGMTSDGMLIYALSMAANYACLATAWGYAAFIADLAPEVPRARAWGWLLQEIFVTVLFGAMALYSVHLKWAALLVALAGLPLRVGSIRLERAAKALG
ncbi:MAG: TMEM175 family protein [Rhodanobacter sp.]